MAPGKTAQGKVDEGLLDTSAALMRVERIGKEYRAGMVNLRQAGRNGVRAFREKLGGSSRRTNRRNFAVYIVAIQRTGQHESHHQRP